MSKASGLIVTHAISRGVPPMRARAGGRPSAPGGGRWRA